MTLPRLPSHHDLRTARRFLALLLLTLLVSLGHVSVPWVLKSSGRQISFGGKEAYAEAKPMATRSIAATPPSLPVATAPAVPRADPARPESTPRPATQPLPPEPGAATSTANTSAEPASPSGPQPSPDGTAILYSVSGRFAGQQVGGSAKLQWKLDPTAYLVRLQVTGSHQFSPLFAWNAQTTGVVSPDDMRPDAYDEEFVGPGDRRAHSLKFTPAEGVEMATAQAVPLDPLSALLKLSSDLYALRQAAASPAEGGLLPTVTVRLGSRSLQFTFERQEDETLSSPFGLLRTEKFVTKSPAPAEGEPEVRLWLAPEFRYAPIRILLTQGTTTALSFNLFSEPADFPAWH